MIWIKTILAGLILLAWSGIGIAAAEEPIRIRFSHVVAETTPKGYGALEFKKRVEDRLAGRVTVEIFPRSQKFNDDEVFLALLFGDVEMAAPSLSKLRSYSPATQVFDLPFLFENTEQIHRFQDGPVGQDLLDSMRSRGIKGLTYWDNGMRVLSANSPLLLPEDAKGMLFRIEPSNVIQAQYAQIGAVGIPMPFKALTDAIRDGLIEGQENSWSNIYSRGIHKLHRYFTELDHTYQGYMVITSSEFWDGLPADIRAVLDQVLAEVTTEVNQRAKNEAVADRERALSEAEIEILKPTSEAMESWRSAFMPVWAKYQTDIGSEVLNAALSSAKGVQ